MNKITSSGLYGDDFGQLVLVTQGLGGYTLVARKKILFRLFLDVAAIQPTAVLATIKIRLFFITITRHILIPAGSLLVETTCPNGPSVGIVFSGDMFPVPGTYQIDFSVQGKTPTTPHVKLTELVFLRSGRLRMLIHNLVGVAPWGTNIQPDLAGLVDMFRSLQRFSAMLPVRDGLKFGLGHQDAGLCFVFGENIDPFNCPSGQCTQPEKIERLLKETNEINSGGTSEHVDATIGWRPRDVAMFPPPGGESAGGKAFPALALASFVGGLESGREKTASVMAQEIGHIFGLVPPDSPHFDGGFHSKNRAVIDPFAFDFYLMKPYHPGVGDFIGDVMGVGWHQGRDLVLFNAFDWDHLRKRLVQLPGIGGLAAAKERPSKKEQGELTDELNHIFADLPKLKIANPGRALPAKKGLVWHWTPLGFQPVNGGGMGKTRSGLTPSAEAVRSWLEDLGISEVYTSIGDRPLPLVINPNADTSLPEKDFVFGTGRTIPPAIKTDRGSSPGAGAAARPRKVPPLHLNKNRKPAGRT